MKISGPRSDYEINDWNLEQLWQGSVTRNLKNLRKIKTAVNVHAMSIVFSLIRKLLGVT